MTISWYGEGCFKIQAGDLTILTDPLNPAGGLPAPRGKFDVAVKTLTGWPISDNKEAKNETAVNIFGPGKYEIKNAAIEGWLLEKESSDKFIKTVYLMELDEVKFGFLGHIAKEFDPKLEEFFKNADILFVPAGGQPFIEAGAAAKLARRLTPKVIIPSFFKIPGLKRPAASPNVFFKELGRSDIPAEAKFSFRKKELNEFKLKIIKLDV